MDVICEEYNKCTNEINLYVAKSDARFNDFELVAKNKGKSFSSLRQLFVSVFLPEGYPESVSDDYLEYQIWDSLQAFSSSITNTLATHAILTGIGVGDSNATPIAATITWLFKDGTAMLGRILFTFVQGSKLDADCKKWRLFADILNDISIAVDIMIPMFKPWTTSLQCLSSLGRSLVGTAGGATRAALTQHQARRNNLADVSAKDGSQETIVNLVALIFSLTVVPFILTSNSFIWTSFVFLTLFHIYANYRAVKSVSMEVVNSSRYKILVDNYLKTNYLLPVKQVNSKENVIPFLTDESDECCVNVGLSFNQHNLSLNEFLALKEANDNNNYFLSNRSGEVNISLYENADTVNVLEAVFHAFVLNFCFKQKQSTFLELNSIVQTVHSMKAEELICQSRIFTQKFFSTFITEASLKGWDFSRTLIPVGDWRLKSHHS
ncbi:RUS1 family protein C16orf58-like protein [Leptotrombidium deliense]|uniref:RUS1 family protein C16orf58-like protein n=1 Tax=Leptotrombidium deliense TaxID=299467 RepID=A0A443SIL3_9ACAR|nr:RUS1 family protein C16orf58-like protein [Leptotrombidium deliense]